MLSPERRGKWWLLALSTLIMLYCGVTFGNALRGGKEGVDLMEVVAMRIALPMGIGLVLLFFYLNKPRNAD